jgi:hypothetical protein
VQQHLDIIRVFYSPTDAQENCFKINIKIFTVVPCSSILMLSEFFIHQQMHKRIALKRILKFTLKQLRHVSVQSPSSGSVLVELAKVTVVKIIN